MAMSFGDSSFSASGRHDQVIKAFEDFKGLIGRSGASASVVSPTAKPAKTTAQPKVPSPGSVAFASKADGLPLQGYLAGLDLPTNWQRATAILIWSAEHDGKENLTAGEIKKLWAKTHFKSPGNLSRDLGVASKNGWIVYEGKHYFAHGFGKKAASEWVAKKD
jgi:hypothetical protein